MPDSPTKRPHFFSGKLLTADDLNAEQQYVIDKFKRHNRNLHGFGIISGLKVSARAGQIMVQPGLALDCQGNEIAIETVHVIDPPKACDWETAYLGVRFAEFQEKSGSIREGFAVEFEQANANSGHRHLRARWIACGEAHALTLAKLRNHSGTWRVDRAYRPPSIK